MTTDKNNSRKYAVACGVVLAVLAADAKSMIDIPVSTCANAAYLSSAEDCQWWNAAWKKRAAILVSNMAKVRTPKTTIDFVLDVGEAIDPASVRIVTPWGVEIPCVAERNSDALRILFQTDLREMENRPFFVYWDNPLANPAKVRNAFSLDVDENEVYVNNGAVEVVFDNRHRTSGLIRKLKVNGSPTPDSLLWRTTGYAWEGFFFETEKQQKPTTQDTSKVSSGNELDAQIHKPDSYDGWSKAVVTANNAFKKTITFTNVYAAVDFTFYAGESRVDYAYRLAPNMKTATIGVSWACGGGIAHDDFYYPGLSGKVMTRRAALDWVTDCEPVPMECTRYPWFGEGWYAFCDRNTRDVVGMAFDMDSFTGPTYLAGATHCGEIARMRFQHKPSKDECAAGSGALVASVGDYKVVKDAYAMLKDRPRVFVAKVQPYRDIPVKRRDLAHDFCVNYCDFGWKCGKPLPGDEWADNIMNHLRERGANTICLTGYSWTDLPISKELYDRICAYSTKNRNNFKAPEFNAKNFSTAKLERVCDAAHAKGMAVCLWHGSIPGVFPYGDKFDPELQAISCELQPLYAECGADSVFNTLGGEEHVRLPKELQQRFGRDFWKWDDTAPYFDSRRTVADYMRKFFDNARKTAPDARVMVFNSDNDELAREMLMAYYPGVMDTLFCEFVAGNDVVKIKHVAKRLRSYFDNEPGRTIHVHYYEMKLDYAHRIYQNEVPFICGINGFSNETISYEHTEPENSQFQADFYRLAEYTRLGEKAAKMAPVKYLAVLRDTACLEADIAKHRTLLQGYGYISSCHDSRVKSFARIPSLSYDVVMTPYFKEDSLKRYKAVYLTDDEELPDGLVKEALAYVEQGGGLVLEGCAIEKFRGLAVDKTKEWKDGEVVEYGKGKMVWTKEVLTDRLLKTGAKASGGASIAKLVASVAGDDPLVIDNPSLDGILQSSSEGMFLGVYNHAKTSATGTVRLNPDTLAPKNSKTFYVLDVRSGKRCAYTNGFEIAVGPEQCGFYLIGDEKFTAIPEAVEAAWCGAMTTATVPNGAKWKSAADASFVPRHCVEFVTPTTRGGAKIERSEKAMLVRHRFCANEDAMMEKSKADDFDSWMVKNAYGAKCYTPKACASALEKASYVHIQCDGADCDAMFADCKEELKALLKRGGGLLFMRTEPGPNASKFLEEVGVFNPWPSTKDGLSEPAKWSPDVSTNHPLFAAKGTWFNSKIRAPRKFAKWDKDKQYAPYVDELEPEYALMVIQEKVLGAGMVIFSHNRSCFTDWYENYEHGDGVLSLLLGMSVKEHALKVEAQNGGPGTVVE